MDGGGELEKSDKLEEVRLAGRRWAIAIGFGQVFEEGFGVGCVDVFQHLPGLLGAEGFAGGGGGGFEELLDAQLRFGRGVGQFIL